MIIRRFGSSYVSAFTGGDNGMVERSKTIVVFLLKKKENTEWNHWTGNVSSSVETQLSRSVFTSRILKRCPNLSQYTQRIMYCAAHFISGNWWRVVFDTREVDITSWRSTNWNKEKKSVCCWYWQHKFTNGAVDLGFFLFVFCSVKNFDRIGVQRHLPENQWHKECFGLLIEPEKE